MALLGLNSAFLQLVDHRKLPKRVVAAAADAREPYRGRVALGAEQRTTADGHDLISWLNGQRPRLRLLLTHHPPSWLSQSGQRALAAELAPPGAFDMHLFGHMHVHELRSVSVGGAEPWRQLQARSLFGLEEITDGVRRSHGYVACRLDVADGVRTLRLWPRTAIMKTAGYRQLVPDYEAFELEEDHGSRPIALPPVER